MPSFAIRDGLVVTPSSTPKSWASRIWSRFAVSIKNFINVDLYYCCKNSEECFHEIALLKKIDKLVVCSQFSVIGFLLLQKRRMWIAGVKMFFAGGELLVAGRKMYNPGGKMLVAERIV